MLGICRPLNQSWYYDSGTNSCQMLPIGSCAGGCNIFPTVNKCTAMCMGGKKPPVCLQKPLLGNCGDTHRAWYYDRKLKFCKMFKHGLCGSNGNRFETEGKCQEVCQMFKKPRPICSAKPATKLCFNLNTKWYFDEEQDTCLKFDRGWCAKNANGFISQKVCLWRCSYKQSCLNCKGPIPPNGTSRPNIQPPNTIQHSNTAPAPNVIQTSNTIQHLNTFQGSNSFQQVNNLLPNSIPPVNTYTSSASLHSSNANMPPNAFQPATVTQPTLSPVPPISFQSSGTSLPSSAHRQCHHNPPHIFLAHEKSLLQKAPK
nr:papilin-like [Dermacentor andersoni]